MTTSQRLGACVALALTTAGSASAIAQKIVEPSVAQFAASPSPHVRLFGAVLKESIWLQADRVVYVCWENAAADDPRALAVQQAVDRTWRRESALSFRGWQRCASQSRGIRIRIDDSGPHTKGLGRMLDGLPAGMVLNFTFNNWSPSCKARLDSCIRSIAVHEFGHAIGFVHEQNRADAPGECQALRRR